MYASGSFLNLLAGSEVPVRLRGCVLSLLDVLPQATMNLLQDSTHTMRGLNARLRGFLEQVSKLQEDNQRMEAQIVNWGSYRSHDWSQQEQAVGQLRAQVRQPSACFSVRLLFFVWFFSTAMFHWCVYECAHTAMFSVQTHTHTHT